MAPAITASRPSEPAPVPGVNQAGSPSSEKPSAPATSRILQTNPGREVLRHIRRMVEAQCDNVGARFFEEARKRHDASPGQEEASRGIYGDVSQEERAQLEDEGIKVIAIPWVPLDDA